MSETEGQPTDRSPFDDPEHSKVLVSRAILQGASIDVIWHHEDGHWGFYTDDARGFEDVQPMLLEQVMDLDSGVFYMSHLDRGVLARRAGDGSWIHVNMSKKKTSEQQATSGKSGCMVILVAALGFLFVVAISLIAWFH